MQVAFLPADIIALVGSTRTAGSTAETVCGIASLTAARTQIEEALAARKDSSFTLKEVRTVINRGRDVSALIIGQRKESTDRKVSLNSALRGFGVQV